MTAKPTAKTRPHAEDGWREARLIPTTGIGGQDEQEQRATSSLLAVMRAVPEFGRALLAHTDAPGGRIRTFTEVRLRDAEEKSLRPDGAIVVERGRRRWRCLVEVKTGGMPLRAEQVGAYLELARSHGFDAVLTISNQITASASESPVTVDGRRLRKASLWHLSWWQVMTEARIQHVHRGITDPDQAWILGELIAYLDNERSGAYGFNDMGDKWVSVRDAARQLTLRATDAGAKEVVARWDEFVTFLALGLRQDLGRDVIPVWPKKAGEPRSEMHLRSLVEQGRLHASIRVPDTVAPIDIEADLRTRQVTTAVEVGAPREGRPKTKVNWMIRQLRDSPDDVRIEVRFANSKETTSRMLRDVRDKPERLLLADPKRDPRTFRVALSKDMGTKRGRGAVSFVGDTKEQTLQFYRLIVQELRGWAPSPPKLPVSSAPPPAVASPAPPDFSDPEAREPGSGVAPEDT